MPPRRLRTLRPKMPPAASGSSCRVQPVPEPPSRRYPVWQGRSELRFRPSVRASGVWQAGSPRAVKSGVGDAFRPARQRCLGASARSLDTPRQQAVSSERTSEPPTVRTHEDGPTGLEMALFLEKSVWNSRKGLKSTSLGGRAREGNGRSHPLLAVFISPAVHRSDGAPLSTPALLEG